jgi:hypothetical protein
MEARCEECGEPAVEVEPTSWNPCWGTKPQWSHEDGEPLCPVLGADGYGPCGVVFV